MSRIKPSRTPDGMLTIASAARELCVTSQTVRRWARFKIIKSVRLGGMIWIPLSELQRVLTPQ